MSKKKKRTGRKGGKSGRDGKINRRRIQSQLIESLSREPQKSKNYKQLAAEIGVEDANGRQAVIEVLHGLAAEDKLLSDGRGKFKMNMRQAFIEGVVDMNQSGSAYVVSDQVKEDIFIPPKFIGQALNGDKVKVFLLAKRKRKSPEGQIVEIIERARMEFAGKLDVSEKYAFVVPDNRKMLVDIYVPLEQLNGAKNGQKVIARITDWPESASSPFGEVTEILGNPGEHGAEIHSILHAYGLPMDFPQHVLDAADEIPTEITAEEIKKRKDFRDITTFTIDPHDAKDFDDALSIQRLDNGNLEIGVHIADVAHYVKDGSILDQEARARATSVYLVDRVVPMLPEVLSNQVCSLRPNEEKLTYSCVFEMNSDAEVVKSWIGRTIILSDRRYTYEDVQEILEGKTGDYQDELRLLNDFAKTLRQRRMDKGAIAFDKVEVRFKLDDEGGPESVLFKVQKDAHKLIEEFMLLANKTVALSIGKPEKGKPKTFIYRIHDQPDPEKLRNFVDFIKKFGYKFKSLRPGAVQRSMNALLQEVQGQREENLIETLAIRTMAKAVYSTENIGHYGLAFDYYSHFTSPIRRYPDVMVHRLLERYEQGQGSADADFYEQLCVHSSEMEKKAADAERDSTKYFQVLFMQDGVGKTFKGVVSGVTEFGVFIEIIENKCEGMIRLREISGDYYYFDDRNHRIIGHNTKRIIQLGDEVSIRVKHADLANRRLDFELLEISDHNGAESE